MNHSLGRISAAAGALLLVGSVGVPAARAEQVDVAAELESLASAHGFSVKGLEQVEDAIGRSEGDALLPRLRRLLEDFDHVILQGPEGGVERVIILGAKIPYEPPPPVQADAGEAEGTAAEAPAEGEEENGAIVLQSVRRGTQHAVQVGFESEGGKRFDQSLLVDTGADQVVLPASLAARLGLSPESLEEREMQTANGRAKALFGKVTALWLGDTRVSDVAVAFVEDAKLGNGGLLGMSVLSGYTMTIDDENDRITLHRK
jgi:clan AA aspartic protease (TIGR02281 family)